MIQVIAHGLEIGHPAAYCIVVICIGIPLLQIILFIGADVIDKWKERKKKND